MNDKFFLDTNIFVYSFDAASKKKQAKAKGLIKEAITNKNGIISSQVIQEFLNLCTRKFHIPMKILDAKTYLEQILLPLCEIYTSPDLYHFALDIKEETQYSFYDSLIVASAIRGGCRILYSEDLQSGRQLGGLIIKNPFISSRN